MPQVEGVIDLLRSQHTHFTSSQAIAIIPAFPCFKLSYSFLTPEALSFNSNTYNSYLIYLSTRKNVTILDIPILPAQLSDDGMHIQVNSTSYLYDSLQHYVDHCVTEQQLLLHRPLRSRTARTRRNQKRHLKLRERQREQTVTRSISPVWNLHQLKTYLKYRHVNINRLPEIHQHQLHLQFAHRVHQQYAENKLSFDEFDDTHYSSWISRAQ